MEKKSLDELREDYRMFRESNEKLYTSMKAFQIAAEESGSLVFTYDTKKQAIFVEPRTAETFGVGEIQEGVPYEMARLGIVTEDTRDAYIRIHEEMINGAKEAGGVVKLVQADGSVSVQNLKFRAVMNQDGTPSGTAVGIYRDITDIRNKEQAYQKLDRVLQGMRYEYIGIFELDLKKGTYTILSYDSSHSYELPGQGIYSEFVKKAVECLVAPDYREDFEKFCRIENLQKKLQWERRIEMEFMTTGKGRKWQRSIFQVSEQEDGIPTKVILYQTDIDRQKSERLMQQEALTEAYRYAEEANAAKTSFLSRMSHDIRTPMNAIIGMTAVAGAHLDDPRRVGECLSKIDSASRHLLNLINEVLDMSKIESGGIELQEHEFNLADLIDNMVNMVLPQINERRHRLDVNISNLVHENVIGDSLRIQQAFVNLISNAVKYTPDGGCIYVSITEKPVYGGNYGEYEFCFADNGIGMSDEFQKVIFEPFTRAEDSRLSKINGTGLGMAITRNLIRMMDGDIKVESKLDKGSRFIVTIHLKLHDKNIENVEQLRDLPVLVVDDDPAAGESTCLVLNSIGMKGEWCQNGREAVRKVLERKERGEDYFAVLLDWKMPEMDGVATAKEIRRKAGPDIPIIFLTAYDWSEIELEARAAGVDRFLVKPLFKSRLAANFREMLHPKEAEPEGSTQLQEVLQEKQSYKGKRVLLAEDNELNAEIAMEILGMTGVTVEWARDGRDAVEKLEQSAEGYYQMVFMDIQMPVMDGYQAAAAIRSLERKDVKKLPILAMTANAFAEDINHAASAGMNGHISKPIDFGKLSSIMEKYLG